MRRTPPLVLLCLLTACASPEAAPATAVDARAVEVARLNDAMRAVAELEASLQAPVRDALAAVRDLDRAIEALRDPDRVEAAVASWPSARTALDGLVVAELPADVDDLVVAVDEARAAVVRARTQLDAPWETSYVDAQDQVLVAVREHATATSQLAEDLADAEATFGALSAEADRFVEQRGRYRSLQEAADAFEVAIAPQLPELTALRERLVVATERHRTTGTAVNAASDRAAEVWRHRPTHQPTSTP